MSEKFNPREYQTLMLDHLEKHPRCALYADMGLGKTVTVLTFIANNLATCSPSLVVAPLLVATTTWVDEVSKWQHLSNIKIRSITGTLANRIAALEDKEANVFTINFEQIPWLQKYLTTKMLSFSLIVVDEASRLKNFRLGNRGGIRAAAFNLLTKTATRMIHLSGTPSPNDLEDLWGQLYLLDRGRRLYPTIGEFRRNYCTKSYDGFSYNVHAEGKRIIPVKIRDICLSVKAVDYFDIEEPRVSKVFITLSATVRKEYNKMKRSLIAALTNTIAKSIVDCDTKLEDYKNILAVNIASALGKCSQITSGFLYDDKDNNKFYELHSDKLDALESIVNENAGRNLLVVYRFRADRVAIKKKFPNAVFIKDHKNVVEDWNAGKIPMLILHPASAGHGLNLQHGGCDIVFFSIGYSPEEYMQVCERIGPTRQKQSGYDRLVNHYHILAKDTVDESILESLVTKRNIQDVLLNSIKGGTHEI